MEPENVFPLPPLSRCAMYLDVVPSICVPITAHVEVQRSTPTPSFNLELDVVHLIEETTSGPFVSSQRPRPRHPRRRLHVQRQLTGVFLEELSRW